MRIAKRNQAELEEAISADGNWAILLLFWEADLRSAGELRNLGGRARMGDG
jgi:hypothetical protein